MERFRKILPTILLMVLLGGGCPWFSVPAAAQGADDAMATVDALRAEVRNLISTARDRVFSALVSIETVTVSYPGGTEVKGRSQGSGTIISPEGHVITNQHVVDGAVRYRCTLADKRVVDAELIGEDPLTDLAVLRLLIEKLEGAQPLPVASFGDSDALQIGDHVLAMGSPFSLARSVTLGIVSNTERVFGPEMGSGDLGGFDLMEGQRTGLFTRWIQHDAVIYPGNSGGPLVNLAGEVVGVNELGGSGLGFAIPSNLAREVTAALIEHGEVPRSFLGVTFKAGAGSEQAEGALIRQVTGESPAARAGLEAGDVLLELDGQPVRAHFPEEIPVLMQQIAGRAIGTELELLYQRDEERHAVRVRTEKLERDRGERAALRRWGLVVQELTPKTISDHLLVHRRGVLVTGVRPGSPAARSEPPLAPGDLLVALESAELESLADLSQRYRALTEREDRDDLVLTYERRGKIYLTLLRQEGDVEEEPAARVPKAWLGVATQPLTARMAGRLGLPPGFRIAYVYPRTEAARAGLEVGDVVVAIEGEKVEPRAARDTDLLARRVRGFDIGESVRVAVGRAGQRHEVSVILEPPPTTPAEARRHIDQELGITVREITFFDRDENRWNDQVGGVVVVQTASAGAASVGGIRSGDLVRRIGTWPVVNLESYKDSVHALKKSRGFAYAEVVVQRGTRTFMEYLQLDAEPRDR